MIVGLTGGIGSGKSTVAAMFVRRGAHVIDTDAIAREVVEPPSELLGKIAAQFGSDVIGPDGRLDRALLARRAFTDDAQRAALNAILHPAILKRTIAEIAKHSPSDVVIVMVPLLFETQFEKNCQAVVAVVASKAVRRERLLARGIDRADLDNRMRAQLPDEEYARRAGIVINNDDGLEALEREVDAAWARLTGRPTTG